MDYEFDAYSLDFSEMFNFTLPASRADYLMLVEAQKASLELDQNEIPEEWQTV